MSHCCFILDWMPPVIQEHCQCRLIIAVVVFPIIIAVVVIVSYHSCHVVTAVVAIFASPRLASPS